ncbi:F-box protein [Trifolium medium]|uniref:F-box protein n=1 Tax=Trifolium medium TaxID=97028 RepID=A0A392N5J4_9FABA|nr:F-box protein [Trifolium medium]
MGTNGGFVPSNLLTLDGNNWERWSALMKSLFGAQYVLEFVQNGYEDLGANPTESREQHLKN